ncbi:MAG: YihY family inner membrane protein [Verrucomicrobiae bacterium]|nr:YihY family inner membrane protein [Verrucomicrobiae bacterium]
MDYLRGEFALILWACMGTNAVSKLKKLEEEARIALDDAGMAVQEGTKASRFQRFLHFWALVCRSFVRNRCPMRASSLAYASLLAMVPMFAVVISVCAGLLKTQGEEPIMKAIDGLVERLTPAAVPGKLSTLRSGSRSEEQSQSGPMAGSGQQSTKLAFIDLEEYAKRRQEIAHQIRQFISNIRSGSLGVTGVIVLVGMAISMLSRIENTFNDIWGATRGRSWFTRVVYYWGAMTLGPLLLVVTLALTSGPYFEATKRFISGFGAIGAFAVKVGMALLPYVIWSSAFAVFYQLMPNTRVQWNAALVGGLVGGCLWQLNNEFSVLYVSRVVTNSKIYGSLGMVPVIMVGMYFAWVILLFGAQVAYAFQNRRAYLQERQAEIVSQRSREFIAVKLLTIVAARFLRGEPAPTLSALAESARIPGRLAAQLVSALADGRLVEEVSRGEPAFLPGRPPANITVGDVLHAVRVGRGLDLTSCTDETRDPVRREFERIMQAERAVASTITIEKLALALDNG